MQCHGTFYHYFVASTGGAYKRGSNPRRLSNVVQIEEPQQSYHNKGIIQSKKKISQDWP